MNEQDDGAEEPQAGSLRHEEGPEEIMSGAELEQNMRRAEGREPGEPMSQDERLERGRAESPPGRAALKHGLYAQGLAYMPCDKCELMQICEHYQPGGQCAWERAWMEQVRPLVAQAVQKRGLDPELYAAQITAAVHAQIKYNRNWGYRMVEGEVRLDPEAGGLVETPSAKRVERLRREMTKAFDELGISPAALAALDGGGSPSAQVTAGVMRLQQTEASRALEAGDPAPGAGQGVEDAEFEAAPAEPPEPPAASDEQRAASDGDDSQGAVEAGEGFDAQAEAGMEGPVA